MITGLKCLIDNEIYDCSLVSGDAEKNIAKVKLKFSRKIVEIEYNYVFLSVFSHQLLEE